MPSHLALLCGIPVVFLFFDEKDRGTPRPGLGQKAANSFGINFLDFYEWFG